VSTGQNPERLGAGGEEEIDRVVGLQKSRSSK
jgi:hypothetical protein